MTDAIRAIRPWLTFIGCVVVVGLLYWGQAIVVPLGVLGADDVPAHARGVVAAALARARGVRDRRRRPRVRGARRDGLGGDAAARRADRGAPRLSPQHPPEDPRRARRGQRRRRRDAPGDSPGPRKGDRAEGPDGRHREGADRERRAGSGLWGLPTAVGPWLEPLATAAFVMVLVVFMLLERLELRDRIIRLFGHGRVASTTRAFDEAGSRVSRYLLVSPSSTSVRGRRWRRPVLHRRTLLPAVGRARRGAALHPVRGPDRRRRTHARALAALEGWVRPCSSPGLFVVLELFTNLVLEPHSTPAPPACPRWGCSSRWRSGPGCGGRSGCSWRRRSRSASSSSGSTFRASSSSPR